MAVWSMSDIDKISKPGAGLLKDFDPDKVQLEGLSVLIIDDEDFVRDVMEESLRDEGCEVEGFGDVTTALDSYSKDPGRFDLVVLDVMMPKLTGPQVFRKMRALDQGIKVLFVTGYSATDDLQQALNEDGTSLLEKPYVHETLVLKLKELLTATN